MSKANRDPITVTNRRRFLRLAASTAAATAFLAAPALAATAPAISAAVVPDPLIALAAAVRKADRRCIRAWDARDQAEAEAGGGFQHPWVNAGRYCCHSSDMVLSACQPNDPSGPTAEEGQVLAAELRRKTRAYRRLRLAAGLGPIDREVKEADRAWGAAMRAVGATPAAALAGIAAKLSVIRDDFREGETSYSDTILRSALRDAERLSGKAVRI